VKEVKPRKTRKSKKDETNVAKEEDLNGIGYFLEPVRVNDLWSDDDPAQRKVIFLVAAAG
jgi:hypothetical protein